MEDRGDETSLSKAPILNGGAELRGVRVVETCNPKRQRGTDARQRAPLLTRRVTRMAVTQRPKIASARAIATRMLRYH